MMESDAVIQSPGPESRQLFSRSLFSLSGHISLAVFHQQLPLSLSSIASSNERFIPHPQRLVITPIHGVRTFVVNTDRKSAYTRLICHASAQRPLIRRLADRLVDGKRKHLKHGQGIRGELRRMEQKNEPRSWSAGLMCRPLQAETAAFPKVKRVKFWSADLISRPSKGSSNETTLK